MLTNEALLKAERHNHIRKLVEQKGRVMVAELSLLFEVSEATIRRDLEDLDGQGWIQRTHGGAVRVERGLLKMVTDADTGKVLGVSMVGRDAGEVIHEAAMGMRFGATVRDFIDMVHVYPTMAEALKIAALSFFKDVSKLSCCAE